MKNKWKVIAAACLVVFAAWMLWPRPLEVFDTDASVAISVTIFDINHGKPDNTYETYELEAGSEQGVRLRQLFGQHTYHQTISGLMGDDTIEDITMVIHLFNGKAQHLTLAGGTTEMNLDGHICRLDYWGADRGTELCEEVLAILWAA